MTEQTNSSFENRLGALEALVSKMEGGGMSLEETMAAYEQGVQMARLLQAELDGYQAKLLELGDEGLHPLEGKDEP